jgi:SAM-dependent methyltransferase
MALIDYDPTAAAAFAAARHLDDDALAAWRDRIAREISETSVVLDLGAGTCLWTRAFRRWYDAEVIPVDPSPAMRAQAQEDVLEGNAENIPLPDDHVDVVWLSTVTHHIPDLPRAAQEIRRVLRPSGEVLIRGAFAGRTAGIGLFAYFPEAATALDARFPSVDAVCAAFGTAGFRPVALEPVPQRTARTLGELVAGFDRNAHTPLMLISDAAFAAGLARLQAADPTQPVIDRLDLLVLAQ